MAKLPFPDSQNYQIFWGGRINKNEQLSIWAQIQIPNLGSKQDLNMALIFKGMIPFGKNPIIHQNYLLT
jgi:hypothetical protein